MMLAQSPPLTIPRSLHRGPRPIPKLFEDLLVIDAATFVAGPSAATVLSDFGAEVIKIETLTGDRYRTLRGGYPTDYNWLLTSRNKKSLAIDLSKRESQDIVHRLAAKADVFITNFFGDQLEEFDLDPPRLAAINPRLIYAQVSGYGPKGSDANRRSFDTTAWWARSGLMEYMRQRGAPPAPSAPGCGDHATAMSLFAAIASALYRRERTGEGGLVSTSLYANGIWSNGMSLQGVIAGVDLSKRRQTQGSYNPFAWIYRSKDGLYFYLSSVNAGREWPELAKALHHPEWIEDGRFIDLSSRIKNRRELIDLITQSFSELPASDIEMRLGNSGVTYSRAVPISEVADDPQAIANEYIIPAEPQSNDYSATINSPIEIQGESKRKPSRAPDVGQHTIEVLSQHLKLSRCEIDQLLSKEIVASTAQTRSS